MKSWLKRYWLPGILTLVGAITVLIAVGTATIWAPPEKITAEIKSKDSVNLLTTAPGMLSLYDSDVKIEVTSKEKVSLAIGYAQDINGWVTKQPHLLINGLASEKELKGNDVSGKDKVVPLNANNATDMWQIYKTSDKGKITETWKQIPGNWSLIAHSEKGPISLQLQWYQKYNNPLFYPLLIVGILLLLVALILGLILYRIALAAQRELEESLAKRKAIEELQNKIQNDSNPHSIPIAAIPEGKQRPSRKSLREAREKGKEKIEVDGLEYATGLLPTIKIDENGKPINPAEVSEESLSEGETAAIQTTITETEQNKSEENSEENKSSDSTTKIEEDGNDEK